MKSGNLLTLTLGALLLAGIPISSALSPPTATSASPPTAATNGRHRRGTAATS
ncbi:hypothetical protein EE612_000035 [Oryza sativa]|nr:hypothetical protein EE612_000035 [Oryza sativa]